MTNDIAASLDHWLSGVPSRTVACSGGVDSLLLSTIAHRHDPAGTLMVHDVTPAVPPAATARVVQHATAEGWRLQLITSAEFDDDRYLNNPRNRCYLCKTHLYDTMAAVVADVVGTAESVLLSGANTDDLGEYRPGLRAADEHGVRHPYVELGIGKSDIRAVARELGLHFADLAASPCLASRLYTGTRVTPTLLRAVDVGEELLRARTGIDVVRCRLEHTVVRVEVLAEDRPGVHAELLATVFATMRAIAPTLTSIVLDPRDYRPGRAFTLTPTSPAPHLEPSSV